MLYKATLHWQPGFSSKCACRLLTAACTFFLALPHKGLSRLVPWDRALFGFHFRVFQYLIVLLKFSSVQFSPHFLRTENRTDRFSLELNRTRTELFRTSSNCWTTRNFEKCALHKFYTLKLIAASNLCLNFFVLMLFEGTSARKREIDKALPYLVMTNHSKLWKPCR